MADPSFEDNFDANLFLNEDYSSHTFSFGAVPLRLRLLRSSCTDYDLTGQVVWPACYALCNYILRHPHVFQGKRVLELGSGAGLSGLLAAQFCASIVLTDGNEVVLNLLSQNVADNASPGRAATSRRLLWGSADVEEMDPHSFDVLMGADILFWPQHVAPLFDTVRRLLTADNWFLLAYKSRAGVMDSQIDREIARHNLHREEIPTEEYQSAPCETNVASDTSDADIHLYR
eukprot:EG_transcript_28047